MVADGKALQACLLGGAIGDSLGADIEFQSLASIQRRFPTGLHDLPPYAGQRGAITDDTQMTLFTAEGLCCAILVTCGFMFLRQQVRSVP